MIPDSHRQVSSKGTCLAVVMAWTMSAFSAPALANDVADQLIRAYPAQLSHADGNALVWKDGTRMVVDMSVSGRSPEALLATADLKDMFAWPYPAAQPLAAPAPFHDPGRARNRAFFDKMYGDCSRGEVAAQLVEVAWLPKKGGKPVKVTRVNGVADKLAAVSVELDALPASFDVFLPPSAGTYNCRPIAGTSRVSAHGHGIAIDLATAQADYWLWSADKTGKPIAYKNRLPAEIVDIFERQGFIWGGRWYHYDTMHFEYRPELLHGAKSPP
jgi:hypothetical protein